MQLNSIMNNDADFSYHMLLCILFSLDQEGKYVETIHNRLGFLVKPSPDTQKLVTQLF